MAELINNNNNNNENNENNENKSKKFVFVVGPTAVGKSQWALEQAIKYQGSIVNIDSVQVYKGLEIGSAAPTDDEKKRVPHHLYSFVEVPQEMTAGVYLRDFYNLIQSENLNGPVFIVGGTGFYIQALEKGMFDVAPTNLVIKAQIEDELKAGRAAALYTELLAADPLHEIHINDHYRLVRAIAVLRTSGETPTQLKSKSVLQNLNAFPYPFLKLGFTDSKDALLARVQKRTRFILKNGIIDETNFFLDRGFSNWSPLSSVGYREVVNYLIHNNSATTAFEALFESIVTSTMQLIKKQKTWFQRDQGTLWSESSADGRTEAAARLDLYLTSVDQNVVAKGY